MVFHESVIQWVWPQWGWLPVFQLLFHQCHHFKTSPRCSFCCLKECWEVANCRSRQIRENWAHCFHLQTDKHRWESTSNSKDKGDSDHLTHNPGQLHVSTVRIGFKQDSGHKTLSPQNRPSLPPIPLMLLLISSNFQTLESIMDDQPVPTILYTSKPTVKAKGDWVELK
jgi:hypothetical protein